MESNMKITYVSTDKIIVAKFNPAERSEDKNISDIVSTMRRDGFWPYFPLICASGYRLADGHRRLAAAKKVGIKYVPVVIVTGKTVDQIWLETSDTKRTLSGKEIMKATAEGLDYSTFRPVGTKSYTKYQRMDFLKMLGDDVFDYCGKNGMSPMIAVAIKKFSEYIGDESLDFMRKVFFWMVETESQRAAIDSIKDQADVNILKRIVLSGEPLRRRYQLPTE